MANRRRPVMGSDPQEAPAPEAAYDGPMPSMAGCLGAFQAFSRDLAALAHSDHPQASAARNFMHMSLLTHAKSDIECLAAAVTKEPWAPPADVPEEDGLDAEL